MDCTSTARLRYEVNERLDYTGTVLQSLDPSEVDAVIEELVAEGMEDRGVIVVATVCVVTSSSYRLRR